ncbi:MAG: peptide ABC transporter substrate-binding protein, partial [Dehalococcoidales bacterium]
MRLLSRIFFFVLAFLCIFSILPGSCTKSPSGIVSPGENDVLNLYGIDPHTLDPAISGDATSHQYVTQIFSGLVRLDNNLEPVPDIAEKWTVSDDGMTYTFFLREDVKFHDGTQVTASDFKYSWERACTPSIGSLTAETYLGDIIGVREMLAGRSPEIDGVTVKDDYTLEVRID